MAAGQIKPRAPGILLVDPISTAATSGDKAIIAGVSGKVIRVYKIFLKVNGAMAITIKDKAGGTALTGAIPLATTDNFALADYDLPLWESALGGDFCINQSTTQSCFGYVAYSQDSL